MATIRRGGYQRPGGRPRIPRSEQLALHAAVLALALAVVLIALLG